MTTVHRECSNASPLAMLWFAGACFFVAMVAPATAVEPSVKDVVYAKVDSHELRLDLFLPEGATNPPLVIYIHGGSWKSNSYKKCLTPWLTDYGYAVASIGYRLAGKAVFPAQIHDCKAAVRWLREHAHRYGYNAERIGVAGASAGGYLALFLGVTGDEAPFEGAVGGNLKHSSRVHAIVDYYGPSDFILRSENQPAMTEKEGSPVRSLLGQPARRDKVHTRLASPAYHVTRDDPPLLIIHGDRDKTVLLDQSERMLERYRAEGLNVALEVVPGGRHGGEVYFEKALRDQVAVFLDKHLRKSPASLRAESDRSRDAPLQD